MADLTFSAPAADSRPQRNTPPDGQPRSWRLDALDRSLTRLAGLRLTIYTGLAECEPQWRRAMRDCSYWGFQSFDWLATWQQTIGDAERVAPYLVFLSDPDGRTRLLLPLGVYRMRGLKALRFLGSVVSDYNAPLIDPDLARELSAEETVRLWRVVLKRLPRVDLVWLHRMPETIDGAANPFIGLPGAKPAEHAYAAVVPENWPAYQKSRRHSLVKYTRRRRRQLSELGAVAFTASATPEEARRILHDLRPLKSQRWRETRCRDLFAEPAYRAFYDRMSEQAIAGGQANAYSLTIDGQVLAALWGFSLRERLYCLLLARADGEWARYSPGSLLLEGIIEWCVEAPDIAIFDLSSGEESFKQRWCDQVLQLFDCFVARSLAGHFFLATYRAKEWLKRHRDLRNFIRRLKGKRPK